MPSSVHVYHIDKTYRLNYTIHYVKVQTCVYHLSFQISGERERSELWQDQQAKGQVKRVQHSPCVSLVENERKK